MDRKIYYVNVHTNEIRENSVPGGIEYEVLANDREIAEISKLFERLDENSKEALKYIINFLDEKPVDKERKNYGNHLLAIYSRIYDLGTEKTKGEIEQLGILKPTPTDKGL